MKILICDALVLAIAVATGFVGGSILWHKIVSIPPSFEVAEDSDDGEDVPEDPDRDRDWRIADDMGVM